VGGRGTSGSDRNALPLPGVVLTGWVRAADPKRAGLLVGRAATRSSEGIRLVSCVVRCSERR